ncbi:hypothetical protein F1880_006570 [Penicillium rolfsii]|nr:hypothetical protein F1880_006570 [Penicillium rolfsii]
MRLRFPGIGTSGNLEIIVVQVLITALQKRDPGESFRITVEVERELAFLVCRKKFPMTSFCLTKELFQNLVAYYKLASRRCYSHSTPTPSVHREYLSLSRGENRAIGQRLKLWLKTSLHTNSNGWVSNEAWEAVMDAHHAAHEIWVQTAREAVARREGLTKVKAEELESFDAR